MISRNDWQTLHDKWSAEDRKRLGDPPAAEQLLAYSRGELPPDEEARIRELLVAYPELARALAQPFPEEDESNLSERELDAHWADFQSRLGRTAAPASAARGAVIVPFHRRAMPVAAMLVLAFVGLYVYARRQESTSMQLRGVNRVELTEGARRGAGGSMVTLSRNGRTQLLIMHVNDTMNYEHYRATLVDAHTQKKLWDETGGVTRLDEGQLAVTIADEDLVPGEYRLELYGVVSGTDDKPLGMYALRVPSR